MITRGHYIGQLVDDFSQLEARISFRTQLSLFDLNKYCEDFIKDVLNRLYGYQLINLNEVRRNTPGLDLGDRVNRIAYQVTSTSTSLKVNDTLKAITAQQLAEYDKVRVIILGKKQKSYSLDKALKKKCNFSENDIFDLNDLCLQLLSAQQSTLDELHRLVHRQLNIVLTEMEVPTTTGEYATTYANKLDVAPETICTNAKKFKREYSGHKLEHIQNAFKHLTEIPRLTRDFLASFIEVSKEWDDQFKMTFSELTRRVSVPEKAILEELDILERNRFLSPIDEEDGSINSRFVEALRDIVAYAIANNQLRLILVALDFTLLDEKPATAVA